MSHLNKGGFGVKDRLNIPTTIRLKKRRGRTQRGKKRKRKNFLPSEPASGEQNMCAKMRSRVGGGANQSQQKQIGVSVGEKKRERGGERCQGSQREDLPYNLWERKGWFPYKFDMKGGSGGGEKGDQS